MKMKVTMILLAAAGALSLVAVNSAAAREPTTLRGKCAKELGAPYDPVRGGWYLTGPNHAQRVESCVQRKFREMRTEGRGHRR